MTDKEEHEYAAKAAGITVRWKSALYGGIAVRVFQDSYDPELWLPKTKNAAAFALMVACKMDVCIDDYIVVSHGAKTSLSGIIEVPGTDPEAAIRLAIVRAAVEIGKAMK